MKQKLRKPPGRTRKAVRSYSVPTRPGRSPRQAGQSWVIPAICFGLIAITWVIFGRSVSFGFLNYDDSYYVYQNPSISDGLTRAGLIKAFTQPLVGNWHPLTSISLMLDAQWTHLQAGGYHLINVLLHTIVVLLLFFALKAMTGAVWRSAFVAAIFAIHPLRVESVVWISERKDVLSGVFFMLGLLAYDWYCKKSPRLSSYLLVAGALTLGLLSKAMLVTFPFLLLLLDYWPLRRFRSCKASWLLLEKVPLLLLSVAASVATILSQEHAIAAGKSWSFLERAENALLTIWVYLRQMFWPTDLAVFYPYPKEDLSLWLVFFSSLLLVVVTVAALRVRKRFPYLSVGWLWYLGMLVPVIGLVQVGWQAHADRYTYLPQIGVYLLLVWGVADLTAKWRRRETVVGSVTAFAIVALMLVTWKQVGYWSSAISLWRHTLAVTTHNDVAERGLGTALIKLGEIDEAIAHDRTALRIRPGDINGLTNLANALMEKGEFAEAIQHYRELVRRQPNDSESHRNLGKALYKSGQRDAAITEFREALRLRPGDSDSAYSLGNALLDKGETDAAISYFRQAITGDPKNVGAHYNLGIALQRDRQLDAAVAEFRATLQLAPRHLDAHNNLAIALLKKGLTSEAITEWQAALEIEPNNAEMHNNLGVALLQEGRIAPAVAEFRATLRLQPDKMSTALTVAWILATAPEDAIRDGSSALVFAKQAFQLAAERNLIAYRVLAAAFAANGNYAAAIETAREGAQRAESAGQSGLAETLQNDLALYDQGVPLRDSTHGRGSGASQ